MKNKPKIVLLRYSRSEKWYFEQDSVDGSGLNKNGYEETRKIENTIKSCTNKAKMARRKFTGDENFLVNRKKTLKTGKK